VWQKRCEAGELMWQLPIADCQLPIANLSPETQQIGNRQSATGNALMWQLPIANCQLPIAGII
jgi:hypothetical protein